ncbi:prepilin peptidase [Rhizosaccharibacter radicis]|uniref:Prepilin leader peptidase/N-methyltransferase n=1 Tax=Rhizosaccharibacter radicis TaxID=2782605 RepID=A0ABT1VV00_9PROT|nr:prepilin peptidase [Acetobacteraceae bacterium KSS12]
MEPSAWLLLAAAPFAGSFAGLLVRRLPENRPVLWDRSRCERCGQALRPWELVPLLSFALLRGRCARCRAPIAADHPLMELAALGMAAASLLAAGRWHEADAGWAWLSAALGWVLLVLALVDLRCFRLPDMLTLPLLLGGLAACWWRNPDDLADHAAAAALGYALFRLLGGAYRLLRGRDGLGQGDAKLLAAAGAWLGAEGLGPVVLVGALLTLGGALILGRWRGDSMLPFGPGLAAACWLWWMVPLA